MELNKKEINVIIDLLKLYVQSINDLSYQIQKQSVHTVNELIDIDVPTYFLKYIYESIDTYIETNQDELYHCEEARTLKDKIAGFLFKELMKKEVNEHANR
tara:strand:+ start:1482 stop:1784 length:303 start_codon:yes stop_codon:yes gene_type:complete